VDGTTGVLGTVLDPLLDEPLAPAGATVPCGLSMSVYRVPSAVLTSVTGLFTCSVIVWEPLAYEPPTIAIVAVVAVSDRRLKTPFALAFGFAAGKFAPLDTDSGVAFTAMTAELGGGDGGAGGTAGADGVPVPEEPLPEAGELPPLLEPAGAPPANGSLLSKRENDSS
jgi:hypothetical protein